MATPKPLTPEDLLAVVRAQSGRFRRSDTPGMTTSNVAPFQPRSYATPLDDMPQPAPLTARAGPEAPAAAPTSAPAPASAPATPSAPAPAAVDFSAAPPPRAIDLAAERAAAFAEGQAQAQKDHAATLAAEIAAARAAAEAAVAAELAAAQDAFAAAILRLSQIEAETMAALQDQMEQAIRQLAAERAGQKIDEAPRPFQRRIEKLVQEIAAGAENLLVRMNPADLMAIRPHIKSFSPLAHARLSPDPALGRGDLRLVMNEISFSDCLAPRSGGGLA